MADDEGRLRLRSGKETYFEYKFGDGTHKTKAEDKIKLLISLTMALAPCRLKEEIKEG